MLPLPSQVEAHASWALLSNTPYLQQLNIFGTQTERLSAVTGINQQLLKTSPLGEWSGLLQAVHRLTSIKPIARALTQSPVWLGQIPALTLKPDEGRQVLLTLLGPAFALAVLPDPQWTTLTTSMTTPQPSVGEQCFSDYQSRRPSDVMASIQSLRLTMSAIVDSLHNISMNFLRNQARTSFAHLSIKLSIQLFMLPSSQPAAHCLCIPSANLCLPVWSGTM